MHSALVKYLYVSLVVLLIVDFSFARRVSFPTTLLPQSSSLRSIRDRAKSALKHAMQSLGSDIESGLCTDSNGDNKENSDGRDAEEAWHSLVNERLRRLGDWEWVEQSMLSGYAQEAHSELRGLWAEHSDRARALYAQCVQSVQGTADFLAQSLPSAAATAATVGREGEEEGEEYVHKHPHSLAMSGCGWLIPFHLGVLRAFQSAGYLGAETVFAGTSGGAIAALVGALEISPERALDELIALSADETFKRDIDEGLRGVLQRLIRRSALARDRETDTESICEGSSLEIEDEAHTQRVLSLCNARLRVTVTRLWPLSLSLSLAPAAPLVVSRFHSERELLDVVAASCFIPLYSSSRRVATKIVDHSELLAERESAKEETEQGKREKVSETERQGEGQTETTILIERETVVDDGEGLHEGNRAKVINSSSIETVTERIVHCCGENKTIQQTEIKTNTTIETETDFVSVDEVPRETKSERDRGYFIDGGVFAFIPPVGEVRISPFPAHYLRSFTSPPDITLSLDDYPLSQLLHWAFYPPAEDALRDLFHKGQQAAERWILKHEAHLEKMERERELGIAENLTRQEQQHQDDEEKKDDDERENGKDKIDEKVEDSDGTRPVDGLDDLEDGKQQAKKHEAKLLGEELTALLGLDWIRDAPKVEDLSSLPEFLKHMIKGTIR